MRWPGKSGDASQRFGAFIFDHFSNDSVNWFLIEKRVSHSHNNNPIGRPGVASPNTHTSLSPASCLSFYKQTLTAVPIVVRVFGQQ